MATGFLKGMLWGTGVSLGALAALSVWDSAPTPERATITEAPRPVPSRPELTTEVRPQLEVPAETKAPDAAVPEATAPAPDTLPALLSETLAPAAVPQTGAASDLHGAEVPQSDPLTGIDVPAPKAPQVAKSSGAVIGAPPAERSDPLRPGGAALPTDLIPAVPADPGAPGSVGPIENPQPQVTTDITQPKAPALAGQPTSISTDPMQPTAPAVSDQSSPFLTVAPAGEASDLSDGAARMEQTVPPEPVDAADPLAETPVVTEAPVQPAEPVAVPVSPVAVTAEASAPGQALITDLSDPTGPETASAAGESLSAQVTAGASVKELAPGVTPDEAGAVTPVVTPVPMLRGIKPLPDVVRDHGEGALDPAQTEPAVRPADQSDAGLGAPPKMAENAQTPATAVARAAPLAPVAEYAVPFKNTQGKPLMAVVLMDIGGNLDAPGTGLRAVQQLPYAVSFAVDPSLPDAADRMQAYRAAGFEVLAMVDLPAGARADGALVKLAGAFEAMPEVIGVLDGVRTGVQTSPEAGRQVAQVLAETGHGFVSQNRGLNTVQKLAAREGVPSAVVFRDFDAKGQDATVIGRFLDHAAFRAGQKGDIVMLGRLRAETISALLSWTSQDRAAKVTMSPVSAVLRVD